RCSRICAASCCAWAMAGRASSAGWETSNSEPQYSHVRSFAWTGAPQLGQWSVERSVMDSILPQRTRRKGIFGMRWRGIVGAEIHVLRQVIIAENARGIHRRGRRGQMNCHFERSEKSHYSRREISRNPSAPLRTARNDSLFFSAPSALSAVIFEPNSILQNTRLRLHRE